MMRPLRTLLYIIAAGTAATLLSCESTPYETGDSGLSYLHADYADFTIADRQVKSIITDDGTALQPPKGLAISDDMPADTMLRRLIHYNMRDLSQPIELLMLQPVAVLLPHDRSETEAMKTDPVKLTSAWQSRNGHYINLHLGVMTGSAGDNAKGQLLQLVCDSTHNGGRGALFLTLYHDQAGIGEYYTEDVHISLPVKRLAIPCGDNATMRPDTVDITIHTYAGTVRRTFITNTENL